MSILREKIMSFPVNVFPIALDLRQNFLCPLSLFELYGNAEMGLELGAEGSDGIGNGHRTAQLFADRSR